MEEVKEVVLRDIAKTGAITQEKSWKRIYELIKSEGLENAVLDMRGVEVETPWKFMWFVRVMKDTNVKFKFINRQELVNQLKVMCVTDNYDPDRIICIEVEVKKPLKPEEKSIIKLGEMFSKRITVADGVETLTLNGFSSQISDHKTVKAIKLAFEAYDKENNFHAEQYIVLCDQMNIDESVIEMVAHMVIDSYDEGINLAFDCREDVAERLNLFIFNISNGKLSVEDKRNFWKNVPVGSVGVLSKYKQTARVDKLGRMGDGEVIASNVCVYKGYSEGGNTIRLKIYKTAKFFTQNHWYLDNDGATLDKLEGREIDVDPEDVGYVNSFFGKRYHFCEPVDNGERYRVIESLAHGSTETQMYTLAERIDKVLSSWDEDYNKELLREFISKEKEASSNE